MLAHFDPSLLFLADNGGRLIAAHSGGRDGNLTEAPDLALELARLLSGQTFHAYRRKNGYFSLLAFGVRLTHVDGAILGGLLGSAEASERQLENLQLALATCGSLAWEAFAADDEVVHLATRIRHLTAEQDTIKSAHRTSAATVIEEREARIREQRDYVVHLEQEVERRSAALREAMERAKDASRAKSEFLANMSHEIRTPMTAVLGFAEALLDPELSREEQVKASETIQRNGKYLLDIINDILDLSKVESGKMILEQVPCRPTQIISDVMALVGVWGEEKNLILESEYIGPIPETIHTDPTRLRQILINVVGNAVKFTDTGSVRLITRFVTSDEQGPMLQYDVVDTGIGMTREEIPRLFQPFSQADSSTTRRFGGTGLGLVLAKRLAQMLGGELVLVESQAGVGTRFRATVATGSLDDVRMIEGGLNEEAATGQHKASAATLSLTDQTKALNGFRILLAEDGPDNQRLIAHMLKKAGAEITVVDNGKLAMDAALAAMHGRRDDDPAHPFDVILMDMQMPVMDGYEATRRLRAADYRGPIIALTAHAMAGDLNKCLNAGCDAYASKPIDRRELIDLIAGLAYIGAK